MHGMSFQIFGLLPLKDFCKFYSSYEIFLFTAVVHTLNVEKDLNLSG